MATTGLDHDRLKQLTLDFTEAFNANDLDGVMSYFAEDAVYDQFNGEPATGLAAIREAFAPQFAGTFGEMRFVEEDLFVDAEAGRALVSWLCTLETKRGRAGWRGLDILHFDDAGKITAKLTYAKASQPLMQSVPAETA